MVHKHCTHFFTHPLTVDQKTKQKQLNCLVILNLMPTILKCSTTDNGFRTTVNCSSSDP